MSGELAVVAQFGFAVGMALLLWFFIQKTFPQILEVVRQNADAMRGLKGAIENNTLTVERVSVSVASQEQRIRRLEGCAHGEEGHWSCPFIDNEKETK